MCFCLILVCNNFTVNCISIVLIRVASYIVSSDNPHGDRNIDKRSKSRAKMFYVHFNFIARKNILVIWFKTYYLPLFLCMYIYIIDMESVITLL
jgi:hypothetical protein